MWVGVAQALESGKVNSWTTSTPPTKSVIILKPAPIVTKPTKPLTWRDNPKHCNQKIEWIAAEPPFKCIKKKTPSAVSNSRLTSVQPVYHSPNVVSGCGDNQYAHFIYMHESGCNLNAVNALGCRGIGQACPGSKLPCGADYACQNAFFTSYAISAYGSWAGAYNFWLGHNWW